MRKSPLAGFILVLLLPTSVCFSQIFSFGVKGGIPLLRGPQPIVCCFPPAPVWMNAYSVGLTGEVRLPFRLAIEADGLVQRVHTNYSAFQIHSPLGTSGRVSGYVWNFPLLVKYYPPGLRFRPYFSAGSTIRHLGDLQGNGTRYELAPTGFIVATPVTIDLYRPKAFAAGITAGGGFSIKTGPFQISPEARYTRWTDEFVQPTRNQVELLLGITFPPAK